MYIYFESDAFLLGIFGIFVEPSGIWRHSLRVPSFSSEQCALTYFSHLLFPASHTLGCDLAATLPFPPSFPVSEDGSLGEYI